jgi:hypothetical protein
VPEKLFSTVSSLSHARFAHRKSFSWTIRKISIHFASDGFEGHNGAAPLACRADAPETNGSPALHFRPEIPTPSSINPRARSLRGGGARQNLAVINPAERTGDTICPLIPRTCCTAGCTWRIGSPFGWHRPLFASRNNPNLNRSAVLGSDLHLVKPRHTTAPRQEVSCHLWLTARRDHIRACWRGHR